MGTTIRTEHENELILVEDVLDPAGRAVIVLGLITEDGSDTFPGRTLTPEPAEELAASLARSATAARATARAAPAPRADEAAHRQTLQAIRAALDRRQRTTLARGDSDRERTSPHDSRS